MSGKIHVFEHHKTASAAWFQYKPPCSPTEKGRYVKVKPGTRAAWQHDHCKPPPCSPKGKDSKAHKAGAPKGCPPPKPPPCGKQSRAHAAGASHGCKPKPCASGVNTGCQPKPCASSVRGADPCQTDGGGNTQTPTQTDQQVAAPLPAPVIGSGPVTQPHTVKKPKHKAKKHAKHKAKKHAAKKHAAKKR
jgi:hypothetical protein